MKNYRLRSDARRARRLVRLLQVGQGQGQGQGLQTPQGLGSLGAHKTTGGLGGEALENNEFRSNKGTGSLLACKDYRYKELGDLEELEVY